MHLIRCLGSWWRWGVYSGNQLVRGMPGVHGVKTARLGLARRAEMTPLHVRRGEERRGEARGGEV